MSQRSPQPNVRAAGSGFHFPVKFWILVVLSGMGAGIGGGLLMRLLHFTEQICYSYHSGTFLEHTAMVSPERRVLVLFLAAVISIVVRRILKSTSGNTGGDLSETVWFRSGKMPFISTGIKALLSIVIVGMGVSLGREGALKQTGAAIASKLSEWFHLPEPQQRLLVACAAGAGMAAAYNVPFGGAIFAVEVLLGTLSLPLMLPALAASFIATGMSYLLLPARPTYTVPHYSLHLADALWACLAGPILGLGAFVWLRAIILADRLTPKGWKSAVVTIGVFTALGAAAIFYPDVLGNGKGVVQLAYLDQLGLGLLLPLFALKMIAAPACLSTGSPGGLFTPTITVGALLGGLLGHGAARASPGCLRHHRLGGRAGRRHAGPCFLGRFRARTHPPRGTHHGAHAARDRGRFARHPGSGQPFRLFRSRCFRNECGRKEDSGAHCLRPAVHAGLCRGQFGCRLRHRPASLVPAPRSVVCRR